MLEQLHRSLLGFNSVFSVLIQRHFCERITAQLVNVRDEQHGQEVVAGLEAGGYHVDLDDDVGEWRD